MPPVATRTPMKTSITNVQRVGALDEVHGTTTPEAVKHLKYADLGAEDPASGEEAAPAGGAALGKHQVLRQWAVRAAPEVRSPKVDKLHKGDTVDVLETTVDGNGRGWVRLPNGWATTHATDGGMVIDGCGPPPSPDALLSQYLPTAQGSAKAPRTPLAQKPVNDAAAQEEPAAKDSAPAASVSDVLREEARARGFAEVEPEPEPETKPRRQPEPEPEPEPEPTPAASAASGKAQTPPDALPRDLGGLLNKEAQSKSEDAVGDFLDALGGGGSEEVLVGQASLRCAPLKSALIVQLLG